MGIALSARTRIPFVDVDRCVEEAEGRGVAEIFATKGEPYFREAEGVMFRSLCEDSGRIIGCGGGTLIDPRNRAALLDGCVSVWLRVSAEDVIERIARPDAPVRPLVEGAPRLIIPRLLQTREAFYETADLVIETAGRGIDEIAEEIRASLALPFVTEG